MFNMFVVKKNLYYYVKYIWYYKYFKIIFFNKFYCYFYLWLLFFRIFIIWICLWGLIGGCLINFDFEIYFELLLILIFLINYYGFLDFKNIKNRCYKLLVN